MTEERNTGANGMTALPVRAPENLTETVHYPGGARYVAFYYVGSNATWDDGLASASFSFYGVFSPLVEHPVMAIHLLGADLGSDDTEPTHALVLDRGDGVFLVGRYEDAMRLVRSQFDEEARREAGLRYSSIFEALTTPEAMRSHGMFEFLFGPSREALEDTEGMLRHLDGQITEELVGLYVGLSKGEDGWRVFGQLRYVGELIKRARREAESTA